MGGWVSFFRGSIFSTRYFCQWGRVGGGCPFSRVDFFYTVLLSMGGGGGQPGADFFYTLFH